MQTAPPLLYNKNHSFYYLCFHFTHIKFVLSHIVNSHIVPLRTKETGQLNRALGNRVYHLLEIKHYCRGYRTASWTSVAPIQLRIKTRKYAAKSVVLVKFSGRHQTLPTLKDISGRFYGKKQFFLADLKSISF